MGDFVNVSSTVGPGSITTTQLADLSVTAGKIANTTITNAQISNTAGITGGKIASNTITAVNIANNTITSNQILNGTITDAQISSTANILWGKITYGNALFWSNTTSPDVNTFIARNPTTYLNGTGAGTWPFASSNGPTVMHQTINISSTARIGFFASVGTNTYYAVTVGLGFYVANQSNPNTYSFLVPGSASVGTASTQKI